MHQGAIYKNNSGRFSLDDGFYWTCGDYMEIYDYESDKWLEGRVEHDGTDYYFTDEKENIRLCTGMRARARK